MSSAKPGLKPVEKTVITKERVVGPPDRFIAVTDGELLSYFKSKFNLLNMIWSLGLTSLIFLDIFPYKS